MMTQLMRHKLCVSLSPAQHTVRYWGPSSMFNSIPLACSLSLLPAPCPGAVGWTWLRLPSACSSPGSPPDGATIGKLLPLTKALETDMRGGRGSKENVKTEFYLRK